MARRTSRYPTELELEILKILWRDRQATVRQVKKQLLGFRDLAYTSVMTIMTIMTEKGYLKRSKKDNYYIYKPKITEAETTSGMLGDIVERLFDGSATAAMVNLLETGDIDKAELAKLRKLITRKGKEVQ
ncbi:MAG: BlaI/MecI/CopY family transcriptional regulator [Planctomycetes bacterium]|nr:BlaI/MecI/CopY family transcriptional regulator [Planctomycetota bacterium]